MRNHCRTKHHLKSQKQIIKIYFNCFVKLNLGLKFVLRIERELDLLRSVKRQAR